MVCDKEEGAEDAEDAEDAEEESGGTDLKTRTPHKVVGNYPLSMYMCIYIYIHTYIHT